MMRLSGVLVFLFLYLFGPFAYTQDSTPIIEGELKQWHPISLTFNGPETSENANPNPFLYYRLNVTFSNGDTSFVVPGFYAADGDAAETSATNGNKWRVYFTPDREGVWNYQVSFRQGNNVAINSSPEAGSPGSLDGLSGNFSVGITDKILPDMRAHGRMTYIGEHYLQFAGSGEYYIKGGSDSPENFLGYYEFDNTKDHGGNPNDLHTDRVFTSQGVSYNYHNDGLHHYDPHLGDWKVGDPVWKGDKGKRIIGAINYLASESVNVQYMLTNNVIGDGQEVYMWTDYGVRNRYDISKLAQWEMVFKHMQNKGIVLHLILQETENDDLLDGGNLGTNRKLYYRELIARFAHHNSIIWNLGEENTNNHGQRDDFAQYIHQTDPYGHFLTVQTNIGQQGDVYSPFLGKDYFDGAAIQEDYWEVHNETITWINKSANAGRKWVVFCDEIGPFQSGITPDGPNNNHHTIRHEVLYANLFAGGAGNEWYFGYDLPHNDLDCEDFRSRDRMWDYTRYSVDFWKSFLPLNRMQNLNQLVDRNDAYAFGNPGEIYTVYVPNGQETRINLDSAENAFRIMWFDPRNGGILQKGTLDSVQGPGWVSLGLPPENINPEEGNDWIAIVGVPNMAPVFQLSKEFLKLNENFERTQSVTVIPNEVPFDEADQIVKYTLSPASVSFANISIDSLTGKIRVTSVSDQTGSQVFTITANDGQEVNNLYQATFTLTVSPPQPPVAVLEATPISGIGPLNVQVDGSQSSDANGPIINYLWNFGDGTTADSSQASHTYSTPGTYTLSLTVVDADGMVSTEDTLIEVREVSDGMLLVVGNANLNAGDQAVLDSLTSWGYEVQVKDEKSATVADAVDVQMILISSTINSSMVNTKFANIDIPVLVWEPYLYDDMKMTGASPETHFGHLPAQNALLMDSAALEIIPDAPYQGVGTTNPQQIGWARPAASAIPIARVLEDDSKLAIFAYEAGATMEGMAAPAIRVGMFWQDVTASSTNTEGWTVFKEILCWATNCKADTLEQQGVQIQAIQDQLNEQGDTTQVSVELVNTSGLNYIVEVVGLPTGLAFDPISMQITGDIQAEVGVYPIMIIASDSDSTTANATLAFNWIVFEPKPNIRPEIMYISDQLNEQGDMVSIFMSATDVDGDNIYYITQGLPEGLVWDSLTGEIYGVITDNAGIYSIRAEAWDDGNPSANAYVTFTWEVIPPLPNQAPTILSIVAQSFEEEDLVNIPLSAADPDEEDTVTFYVNGLPQGLALDTTTNEITGQVQDTVGNYTVTVIATDNGVPVETDTLTFPLTIEQKVLQALFLIGKLPLNNGDAAIDTRLKALGYEVEILVENQAQTSSGEEKEMIFISSTVNSAAIGNKYTNIEVPLICAESYLYDDLKMVKTTAELGNLGGQIGMSINDVSHAASAGLSGEVNTTIVIQDKSWGTPAEQAQIIANSKVDADKATIFSYEKGDMMVGIAAPEKRMGFFLRDETAAFLTEEGWSLFDAAVCWTGGCRSAEERRGNMFSDLTVDVYPNPVSDILKIEFPTAKTTQINVFDLMGKSWIQKSVSSHQVELNMSALPAGVYILYMAKEQGVKAMKIVKR